jgi:hypothetical protein
MVWDAATSGDKALLQQCLVGATAEDLNFEKVDDEKVRHHVDTRFAVTVRHSRNPAAAVLTGWGSLR